MDFVHLKNVQSEQMDNKYKKTQTENDSPKDQIRVLHTVHCTAVSWYNKVVCNKSTGSTMQYKQYLIRGSCSYCWNEAEFT